MNIWGWNLAPFNPQFSFLTISPQPIPKPQLGVRIFILILLLNFKPSLSIRFVRLCEDAYLVLRRRATLFINLLAMMLQTGTPELHSIDDLSYVRDALVLGVTEKEATEHFHSKLQEARKNAWSTSLSWHVHGLAKDNRQ